MVRGSLTNLLTDSHAPKKGLSETLYTAYMYIYRYIYIVTGFSRHTTQQTSIFTDIHIYIYVCTYAYKCRYSAFT